MTGSRSIPGPAAAASHTGSVTVTIPTATLPARISCWQARTTGSAVVEADEVHNCKAAGIRLIVTP